MEILKLECLGQPLLFEASMAGWQQLSWAGNIVSQQVASERNEGKFSHQFTLSKQPQSASAAGSGSAHADMQATVSLTKPEQIVCELDIDLQWQPFSLHYQMRVDGQVIAEGSRNTKDIERQEAGHKVAGGHSSNVFNLGALALKLFKSAKFVKVALAGLSLAAYSWLFSFQFAIALIICLVFHEYGHLRAMKYFGLKTKGIYLIPFFGGAAVTDEKLNTRWQDVAISLMGPCFGLGLSLLLLLAYLLTDAKFLAALSVFNALINLFNLLPILPLDGGHILKSIAFSINSKLGLTVCMLTAAAGVFLCYMFHLILFAMMLVIGSLEVLMEWRTRHNSHLLPLDRYGQIFSTVWYFAVLGGLMGIVWYFAGSADQVLGVPMKILQS